MKNIICCTVLLVCFFSCRRVQQNTTSKESKYFNVKEDQFGFLVFDNDFTKSFFKRYNPLVYTNEKLTSAFADTLLKIVLNDTNTEVLKDSSITFLENSKNPTSDDFKLAGNVLRATTKQGGEKYFSGSLEYLFFYNCLPTTFRNKWVQGTLGDFNFNANFFALLRDKSKELDSVMYGEINYQDPNIKNVFSEDILNEITPAIAKKIMETILNDPAFNDERFTKDKLNLLTFLGNTISQKWRLLLLDWN